MQRSRLFIAKVTSLVLTGVLLAPSFALAQGTDVSPSASSIAASPIPVAQEGGIAVMGDFQISPTRFTVEIDPGQEQTIQISLLNRGGKPYSFSFHTEDFSSSEEGAEDIRLFGKADGPFSARKWVSTDLSSLTLEHGQRATLSVRVAAPASASAGDHYAAFLIQRDGEGAGAQPGFNVISQIGALILITVRGPVERVGNLEIFRSQLPVYWWLPATLLMEYRNEGTVHLVPKGSVVIKNIFGVTVDEIPVKDWYVLRNSVRRRTMIWQPKFALGYYSATVTVQTAANENPETLTSSFWVVPIVPVALVLLVIFVVSLLVQTFVSRFEIRRKAG